MKKIDGKEIGGRALQSGIVAILNTPLWVFIGGSMLDTRIEIDGIKYDRVINGFNEEWYQKGTILLFVAIGIMLSISMIKFLVVQAKDKKAREKQTKDLKDAIREQKDIDKYL